MTTIINPTTQFEKHKAQLELELFKFWVPHDGQVRILRALFVEWADGVFLQCGRKFAKSESAVLSLIYCSILFDDSQTYYIADTQKHGGELVWENGRLPRFFLSPKRWARETEDNFKRRRDHGARLHEKYIRKVTNNDMRMRFHNDSFVSVDGSDNFANADGINPHFIVYDEFKHHDRRFHEAMEPNLVTNRAQILIMGTPPYGDDNYYTEVARRFKSETGYRYFQFPSYMNTYLYPKKELDPLWLKLEAQYAARGEKSLFDREYRAKSVKGGGLSIFPMFLSADYEEVPNTMPIKHYVKRYTAHVRPHDEVVQMISYRHKDWDFYIAYDPGTSSCFAVLLMAVNRYSKKVVVLDEIYEKDKAETSSKRIYPRSVKKMEEWKTVDDFYKTYDNAAAWFAMEVANEFDVGLLPCSKDVKKKEDKISLIKDIMSASGLFIVSERCRMFGWEIDNYVLDDKGKIPKSNDHLLDCFRYALSANGYSTIPEDIPEKNPNDDDIRYAVKEEFANGCKILSDVMEVANGA